MTNLGPCVRYIKGSSLRHELRHAAGCFSFCVPAFTDKFDMLSGYVAYTYSFVRKICSGQPVEVYG